MRISKKILAIALSVLMAFSMMPITAFATEEPTVTWDAATENIQIGEDINQSNSYDASYTKDAITVSATSEEGHTYIDGTRFMDEFMGSLSGFVFTNSVANFTKIKLVFTNLIILSYNQFLDSEYNVDPHWSSDLDSKTVTWEGDSNSVGLYAYGVEGTLDRIEFTYEVPAIDSVSYKNAAYDSATNTVTYTDASCDDYTVVAADTTTFEDGKWYVVNSNVTVNGSITVNGAANLILTDGYTLTVTQGVAVTDPNSLTIFGQENGTGTLTATSTSYGAAGIGGNDDENGPITINGGTVNATSGGAGAGIGGGDMGNGGPVVINGGTVTAIGGEDDGAGIGSGGNGSSCNVTINGGTVNATGRHTYDNTAGIGNSGWSSNGGNIAINGGTVNAACAAGSQGIGGSGCTISITGGTVDVNRGVTDASYGLFGSSFTMSGGEVYVNRLVYVNTTITGGTLIAEANPPFQSDVSIGTGLKVLAGANEESAVEVEPSAINMSSDVYWNSKWIKIYPAPPIKPDGFNLTVEDKVQMNLYINVDDYTDPETATVTVTYNDPEAQAPTPKTDTYSGEALAALKDADDGRYVIPVLAAPAQIRDNVTVTVTDRDPITTNVATYCETIIAESNDGALVDLANAILDYGKACSAEFNYNVAAFDVKDYHYSGLNATDYLNSKAVINTENVNGKFTGYSYIAKVVPALRIYLNTTEAEVVANDLKATVNGTEVTPKAEEGTGKVCVDITGILAESLDVTQTVEFNGGTLTLNALQYAKAKGGDTDFGRSMAVYNFTADAYFA